MDKAKEAVNSPAHYNRGKIEVIDYIEDQGLDFCLGNAVKYISRAGHKGDRVEDIKKAIWYLQRSIKEPQESSNLAEEGPKSHILVNGVVRFNSKLYMPYFPDSSPCQIKVGDTIVGGKTRYRVVDEEDFKTHRRFYLEVTDDD